MFNGDEFVRFSSAEPAEIVFDRLADELAVLGEANVDKKGNIEIYTRRTLDNLFTQTIIEGRARCRKGVYTVTLYYSCTLSTLGWVVLILGAVFLLVGLLVLLAPLFTRNHVTQVVRRALQDLEEARRLQRK